MTMLPTTIEPEVRVSLDGSGAFDGEFDDITGDIDSEAGIALSMWRDGVQQLSPMKMATGDFELRNEDGYYSADRADSPLYQRFTPGKAVRYRAYHGSEVGYRDDVGYRDNVYYRGVGAWTLGRHVLNALDPDGEIGNQRVRVATLGYEVALTKTKVTIALMLTPLVSECFTAYLDAVAWPADKRRIATSDTRLLLYYADGRVPWDGMLELLASEGPGAFGIDRDGTFYFENRNYRTTAERATTSQATFWDREAGQETGYREEISYRADLLYRGLTSGLWFTRFRPRSPYDGVYNRATYRTRRRVEAGLGEVWAYGADINLDSGQPLTVFARPQDPFLDAVTPTLTTDYTVTGGTVSVSMSADSGLVAFITLTPTSGTPTVSGLRLRAKALTVVGETTVENNVDASASIAAYSPIPGEDIPLELPDQSGWQEMDIPNGVAVCNAWVLRQQRPRPQGWFTIRNANGDFMEKILSLRHSDRVTLVDANSGLSADVWVNSADLLIWGPGGKFVELVLGYERCDDLEGAVWDESEWDSPFAVWGI